MYTKTIFFPLEYKQQENPGCPLFPSYILSHPSIMSNYSFYPVLPQSSEICYTKNIINYVFNVMCFE